MQTHKSNKKANLEKQVKSCQKKINETIRNITNLKQWRKTQDAIEWFESIENKENKEMIQLDIENVYFSVSDKLLLDTL